MTINKRIYWTITGLTAAFMLLASIPDVLVAPGAVAIFQHLGYPTYLLPFLGIAKSANIGAAVRLLSDVRGASRTRRMR